MTDGRTSHTYSKNNTFVQNTTSVVFKNPFTYSYKFNANFAQQRHETVISQRNLENKHECTAAAGSPPCNERIIKLHSLLQAITSSSTHVSLSLSLHVRGLQFFIFSFIYYYFVFCTNEH